MADLPQSLSKYDDQNANLDLGGDDSNLVKVKTLKAWLARVIKLIPKPGDSLGVRRNKGGDIWDMTAPPVPFQISSTGKIHPGLVGTLMPTLDGEPLNTTANLLDLTYNSGNFDVWFTLTFSITYSYSYLSAYTLSTVVVDRGTSVPSDTDSVKHLRFNTLTNGQPSASFFTSSINVGLKDNGANSTLFYYGS